MTEEKRNWNFDEYDWIENYDERMRSLERLCYDETLTAVVVESLAKEDSLVLDIGTGTGNLAIKFLEAGCQVIGLDPSVRLLRMAEQKVIKWGSQFEIRLCEDPFIKIPFFDDTFDVIASTYAIHHLTDNDKQLAIREMKRVLRPDGRIVIGDVMFKDTDDKVRALGQYSDMEDEYQPTLDTFPGMFEDEKFRVKIKQIAETVWIVCAELG